MRDGGPCCCCVCAETYDGEAEGEGRGWQIHDRWIGWWRDRCFNGF